MPQYLLFRTEAVEVHVAHSEPPDPRPRLVFIPLLPGARGEPERIMERRRFSTLRQAAMDAHLFMLSKAFLLNIKD